ncbi:MAG TPA: response regulator [Candidatus Binatia bacterium]|nr:response regulator [Candidatus Binatia bacterium]
MSPSRILVVDDSLTIRRALEFILKPHGYALEFAADGRDALNRASSFAPDLVLLDYVLPDMRGPDVCAALAVMPITANTPVILVSAKGASIRQAYQDAQNVVSYITKPFKPEVVTAVVANALARLRAAVPSHPRADAGGEAAADAARGTDATPATTPRGAETAAPATVHDTFSALLRQLEDVIAADALEEHPANGHAPRVAAKRTITRLAPGLARASDRMSELARHVIDGKIAPYRLRPDGSFASIAATLLDAHRSLCEAAIALAAAGAAGARATPGPRVVAACPVDHPLHAELATAIEVAPEVPALVIEGDFAALPALVRLLGPEYVVIADAGDAALREAAVRARAIGREGTRFVALGDAGHVDDGAGFEVRLADADAIRGWVGELARGAAGEPATAVEMGLEIVTV